MTHRPSAIKHAHDYKTNPNAVSAAGFQSLPSPMALPCPIFGCTRFAPFARLKEHCMRCPSKTARDQRDMAYRSRSRAGVVSYNPELEQEIKDDLADY